MTPELFTKDIFTKDKYTEKDATARAKKCMLDSGAKALEKVEARSGGPMDLPTKAGFIKINDTVLDE